MQELIIIQDALDTAISQANKNGAAKIDRLTVNIGELSEITSEAIEFAFYFLASGTIAEDAKLEIEIVPAVCYCQKCDREFRPCNRRYECPQCLQVSSKILAGNDWELGSLGISS